MPALVVSFSTASYSPPVPPGNRRPGRLRFREEAVTQFIADASVRPRRLRPGAGSPLVDSTLACPYQSNGSKFYFCRREKKVDKKKKTTKKEEKKKRQSPVLAPRPVTGWAQLQRGVSAYAKRATGFHRSIGGQGAAACLAAGTHSHPINN